MVQNSPVIYHIFSTFAVGGPQRRLAQLAASLPGVCHVITAMDGCYDAQALFNADIRFELKSVEIVKGSFFSLANIRNLRQQIVETSPALLCTYNWGTVEAVIANGGWRGQAFVPHVHFEDGFGPDERPDRQNWKRALARRYVLRNSQVAVPSNVLKTVAVSRWHLPEHNLHYLPNGIDLERFQPGERPPGRRVVIGTLGALRPEKNLSRLIRIYHDGGLRDQARLIIAGDGPERAGLESQVTALKLDQDVTFTGHTDNPTEILHQFDMFALTSDTEQMPLSVLEAMACGLPVVSTDVGDVKAMVSPDSRSYIVPVSQEKEFGARLAALAHDRMAREKLGAANRSKVKEFSLDQMVESYGGLFRKVTPRLALPGRHQT